ncbi:GumC family protein [Endozoicomonas arenosclerae]|uniref:GumC family protein n=1 Tax=Endozoicomonas arenosclerae TaxID=1633495 RepID=UPI000784555F|nr:GNVR domain-containing protein [Endozoicomonas arenosclerae]
MTGNEALQFTPPTSRELLTILFEQKTGMIVLFFSTLLFASLIVFFLLSPKYESKAILLVNSTEVTQPIVNGPPKSDFEKVTNFHTQKDIIESIRLAAAVVEDINLDETRALGNIEKIKISLKGFKAQLGELLGIERWTKPWDPEGAAIAAINKNLKVTTSPESKAIKIAYRAYAPQEAAETLDALIKHYKTYYYDQISLEASGIINYLKSREEESRQQLLESETAILLFKREVPATLENYEGLKYSTVSITDSAAVQDEFKLYILQLEEELRQLRQKVPESDPRVEALKDKLASFITAVNELPGRDMELQRLKRLKKLAQEKYLLLARNLEQAKLIAQGQANNLGLISILEEPAVDDAPVSPKKRLILILAIFMGTALALAWAYLVHFLDSTIRRPEDMTDTPSLSYLGSFAEVKA